MASMRKFAQRIFEYAALFCFYGCVYFLIEFLWRRNIPNVRMFFLGGGMAIFIGAINNIFDYSTDFLLQCFMGMVAVVLAESIFGYRWNVVEGLNIWNYSALRFSGVDGQVNLYFAVVWFMLSGAAIISDDAINYYIFNFKPEEPPFYCILGHMIFRLKKKNG
ncbi:MAG: hypothetical protein HFE62_00585 [Firmicutes bacterium]|nr:hypothetical protein [Bacillota bacterium]